MNRIGRIYSSIVFQNISIIIAAGILNILFGPNGWKPDAVLSQFIDPIYRYVLPLMLAYSGGKLYGGHSGGIVANVAMIGLIMASDMPMIIGAIIFSPPIGWLSAWLERRTQDYIPIGSELLIANLIDALLGIGLMLAGYYLVGSLMNDVLKHINSGLVMLVGSAWLPFLSLVIEPAKVMFLNNLINHGIVAPFGIQQARELGKSIIFLVEANPGPGFGVLLAYLMTSSKEEKPSIRGTAGIQLFGGIHEVYFPYILMKPALFFAVIAGGFTGISFFQIFDVGLVSTASPGSILLILFLAPQKDILIILAGVGLSAVVSCIVAHFILVRSHAKRSGAPMESLTFPLGEKNERPSIMILDEQPYSLSPIRHVTISCDGGMASSAMGAAILRRKVKEARLPNIQIEHRSIDDIPTETDLIIIQHQLKKRMNQMHQSTLIIGVNSLSNLLEYDDIVLLIKNRNQSY
ncbi:PTS mannitol transporter subunit IIBC [Bacillus sp. mrc49]|uniref:PTS mannitol transporter subunit IIBC n=1 Tax=Bacillus sp. mrc49 TaxID=2054913 RepID=UPI0012FD1853|nr:PTS mannitol transporter subunit IIBC [Bacillus sp. mrc49]